MPEFYLAIRTVLLLGLTMLGLLFLVHLIRTGKRYGEDPWFTLTIVLWTISFFTLATLTGIPMRAPLAPWLFPAFIVFIGLMMVCFIQFIYLHHGDSFPRERKIIGVLSGIFVVWVSVRLLLFLQTVNAAIELADLNAGFFTIYFWSLVLVIRKQRVYRKSSGEPKARVFLPFLLVLVLLVGGSLMSTETAYRVLSPLAISIWTMFQLVATLLLLTIGKLHYSPAPTTVQIKLVGITLGALIVIMATTFNVIYPYGYVVELSEGFLPETGEMSLSFTPQSGGGYQAELISDRLADSWDHELEVNDLTYKKVAIGFAFPFFGANYDSIYVNPLGDVAFSLSQTSETRYDPGFATNVISDYKSFFDDNPRIAAFAGIMFSDSGQLFVGRTDSSLSLTWNSSFEKTQFDENQVPASAQMLLFSSGEVQFRYKDFTRASRYRGLYPGNISSNGRYTSTFSFQTDTPLRAGADEPLMEMSLVSARAWMHSEAIPLLILLLVSFVFVLAVFPVLFRTSILAPLNRLLEGVRDVNEGKLDTAVSISTNDEIGQLTGQFNEMTVSLKGATQELEDRVERRTEQLSKSLDDLHATQAQLVQQEKLASLGSLTAGIAHEIKNPLNFVNNFAEVSVEMTEEAIEALESGNAAEAKNILNEMRDNSSQIAKHGKRADAIVRSMMQHARGGTSVHESVDVAAFLDENINLAWHGRRAKDQSFQAEVIRDFAEEVGEVRIQPMEMGRVILNLLNNAFDAVSDVDGGAVRVTATRSEADVMISVVDNGPGIPKNIREKIFEPFFTTKVTGEGTGLGLSMSHDIVTKGHGGSLTVDQASGSGAEFTITLPA